MKAKGQTQAITLKLAQICLVRTLLGTDYSSFVGKAIGQSQGFYKFKTIDSGH